MNTNKEQYEHDYTNGKLAESEFKALIKPYYKQVWDNISNDKEELKKWDIGASTFNSNFIHRFEIKWDMKAEETGNFAIELFHNNKQSGINATISDYWVEKYNNNFYIFKTLDVKNYIEKYWWSEVHEDRSKYYVNKKGEKIYTNLKIIPIQHILKCLKYKILHLTNVQ